MHLMCNISTNFIDGGHYSYQKNLINSIQYNKKIYITLIIIRKQMCFRPRFEMLHDQRLKS